MSTAVKVCSDALVALGLNPINSFDELSDRARAAANLYPQIRDNILRSHTWNCATTRTVLSPDSVAPAFEWTYAYTLPGNWLRVLSITEDPLIKSDYCVESGKILTDENPVYLRYIWRNDNPATWDASLFRAMTVAMAAVLAIPACESESKKQEMERELIAQLRSARAIDGLEDPSEQINDFPLLTARF